MKDEKLNKRLRTIEKYLKDYNSIEASIEGLELEKKILLENNTYGINAINFDSIKVSRTNKVNKRLENEVIEFIDKIDAIINKVADLKILKCSIDTALKRLPLIKQSIIKQGYIYGIQWNLIGRENLITQKTLRKFKQESLEVISDYLKEKGY